MDLLAYVQIGQYKELMENVEIPRLRGYQLATDMELFTNEEIEKVIKQRKVSDFKEALCSEPFCAINPKWVSYGWKTDYYCDVALIREKRTWVDNDGKEHSYMTDVDYHMEYLHGKDRRNMKYILKCAEKRVREYVEVWNKYAGKENIMRVHARIGGGNWGHYGGYDIEKKPWFIERAADLWDCTYCDIYVDLTKVN